MNVGGIRTSMTTRSGSCSLDDGEDGEGVTEGRDNVVTSVLEQPGQALPKQDLVLDDHDAHGSSAVSRVPSPG